MSSIILHWWIYQTGFGIKRKHVVHFRLISLTYFYVVSSVVSGWFIWRRFTATCETVARVEVEQNARRSQTSAPFSMRVNYHAIRDRQDAQANQRHRISNVISLEVPRGVENLKQANRFKRENMMLPGT